MAHYVRHYSRFCVGCCPEWCTTCTNYSAFRVASCQNGAPHAPFFRFSRIIPSTMVYWMHQLLWFSGCFLPKRCTACTIFPVFTHHSVQNGVLDAPITLVFGLLPAKTVHHMHQSFCFSSSGGLKWCTTCTIIPGFAQDAAQNGALDAPFALVFGRLLVKMVHHMHHFSGFQASFRRKWCTGCTNYSGFRDASR